MEATGLTCLLCLLAFSVHGCGGTGWDMHLPQEVDRHSMSPVEPSWDSWLTSGPGTIMLAQWKKVAQNGRSSAFQAGIPSGHMR